TSFAAVDPEKRSAENAADSRHEPQSNVRTIFSSRLNRQGDELAYIVQGNGFLHHMVRNLVGTLLLAGKGTLTLADVQRILKMKSRSAAGATAPASGLWLMNVEY